MYDGGLRRWDLDGNVASAGGEHLVGALHASNHAAEAAYQPPLITVHETVEPVHSGNSAYMEVIVAEWKQPHPWPDPSGRIA